MGRKPTRRDRSRDQVGTSPALCVDGHHLCQLRVWNAAEWEAIPADRRPHTAQFFPGLGWVAAIPIQNLN